MLSERLDRTPSAPQEVGSTAETIEVTTTKSQCITDTLTVETNEYSRNNACLDNFKGTFTLLKI